MKLLGIKKFYAIIVGFLQIDFQGVKLVKVDFLHKKIKK